MVGQGSSDFARGNQHNRAHNARNSMRLNFRFLSNYRQGGWQKVEVRHHADKCKLF